MTPHEQLLLRKKVIEDMLAHTEWTPAQALGYMRGELRLTTEEVAKLSTVPVPVIESIEQGTSTGTVEELNRLLGVLGLKLGVVRRRTEHGVNAAILEKSDDINEPSAHPLLDVVEVEAMPGYSFRVTFENGEVGIFEMSGLFGTSSGVLQSLRARELFAQAFVANGTVCWPGDIKLDRGMVYRMSVPEPRNTGRRLGIAKGAFEVPNEQSDPGDPDWETMPEVGREVWPTYSRDAAAWAVEQSQALRRRAVAELDRDHLAGEILALTKAEQRELGRRVSALMVSLAKQHGYGALAGPANARLVREQRKLVLLQLSDFPSLEKYLSDTSWLSHCWSEAVVVLGAAGFPVEDLPEECQWDKTTLLE